MEFCVHGRSPARAARDFSGSTGAPVTAGGGLHSLSLNASELGAFLGASASVGLALFSRLNRFGLLIQCVEEDLSTLQILCRASPRRLGKIGELGSLLWGCCCLSKSHAIEGVLRHSFGSPGMGEHSF